MPFPKGTRVPPSQLLALIKQTPVKISGIKSVQLKVQSLGSGGAGARKFKREWLPNIRYNNPNIPIVVSRDTSAESALLVTAENETVTESKVTNMSSEDILQLLSPSIVTPGSSSPSSSSSSGAQKSAVGAKKKVVKASDI